MIRGLLLSTAVAVGWIFLVLLVIHLRRPARVFFVMTALFLPALPVFLALYFRTSLFVQSSVTLSPIPGAINGCVMLWLYYCTWIEAYYFIDRPVTFRILVELVRSPGGTLTLAQMKSFYSLEEMIDHRLKSMILNGYLTETDGRYSLTAKGRTFAAVFRTIRGIYNVPYYFEVK